MFTKFSEVSEPVGSTQTSQCNVAVNPVATDLGPVAPNSVNFNHQLAYFAAHSDTTHVRHQPTAVA